MALASDATPQKVCPHCATLAYTADRRCPYCRRSYRRHTLLAVAAMLLVTVATLLGGAALGLALVRDRVETEVDRRIRTVQDDVSREVRGLRRDVRSELERRLPSAAPGDGIPSQPGG